MVRTADNTGTPRVGTGTLTRNRRGAACEPVGAIAAVLVGADSVPPAGTENRRRRMEMADFVPPAGRENTDPQNTDPQNTGSSLRSSPLRVQRTECDRNMTGKI